MVSAGTESLGGFHQAWLSFYLCGTRKAKLINDCVTKQSIKAEVSGVGDRRLMCVSLLCKGALTKDKVEGALLTSLGTKPSFTTKGLSTKFALALT